MENESHIHNAIVLVARLINEGELTIKEAKELQPYFDSHEDLFHIEGGKSRCGSHSYLAQYQKKSICSGSP